MNALQVCRTTRLAQKQPPCSVVALGGKVIEKALDLKRSDGGPDASFSMEPEEFQAMVKQIRNVEKHLGQSLMI